MQEARFQCDWQAAAEPLPHFWEQCVGSCHAPLALRADWQEQLRRCHEELGFRYVRFHGLLCDDLGTLVCHKGRPLYSFYNADCIWDFLLSIGMKPFVELSFMPGMLASGEQTVFHYRANVTPPRDYHAWGALIEKLVAHWIERYGREEARQWFFEVWNEPNLSIFWAGSQEDYFRLYRHTARAIKSVDSQLRVGGPATAKEEWIEEFLDFCARDQVPVDFVSTHHYPNDVLWHDDQDTEGQLAHSRRSILREWTRATRQKARGFPLYYTEWNCSSNCRYEPQDEPYAAAYAVKTILEAAGLVDMYSFWTFTDIFEESYFSSLPFHGGFGLLNLHGIAKPVYRAFELLHRLGCEQLAVHGAHGTVDAWLVRGPDPGIAAREARILLTNLALPRHPINEEEVHFRLSGVPPPRSLYVERIDDKHANAKGRWQEMGQPEYLTGGQVEELHAASRLMQTPLPCDYSERTLSVTLIMPPQSAASVTVEF